MQRAFSHARILLATHMEYYPKLAFYCSHAENVLPSSRSIGHTDRKLSHDRVLLATHREHSPMIAFYLGSHIEYYPMLAFYWSHKYNILPCSRSIGHTNIRFFLARVLFVTHIEYSPMLPFYWSHTESSCYFGHTHMEYSPMSDMAAEENAETQPRGAQSIGREWVALKLRTTPETKIHGSVSSFFPLPSSRSIRQGCNAPPTSSLSVCPPPP
jgi:hypothetical protein